MSSGNHPHRDGHITSALIFQNRNCDIISQAFVPAVRLHIVQQPIAEQLRGQLVEVQDVPLEPLLTVELSSGILSLSQTV